VHSHNKAGASYGYTRVLGYHPLLATRADSGEVLHARMRKGSANTSRALTVSSKNSSPESARRGDGRARRAGRLGVLVRQDHRHPPTPRRPFHHDRPFQRGHQRRHRGIPDSSWVDIDYTDNGGAAQVAECGYGVCGCSSCAAPASPKTSNRPLFPTWRHHAFLTDLAADTVAVDRFHRHHAVVELGIRDLKKNSGLHHIPSGHLAANSAWLACAVIAHVGPAPSAILSPTTTPTPSDEPATSPAVPARIVNLAGTPTLRGPLRWPWATQFLTALEHLRALKPASG
jgi:hypothetical protein